MSAPASRLNNFPAGWALLTVAALAFMLLPVPSAGAASRHGSAHARGSSELRSAVRARSSADHKLVSAAKVLRRCRSHRGSCASQRRRLQSSGTRLSLAERRVARAVRRKRRGDHATSVRRAPSLRVAGRSLKWTRVRGVHSYVFVRKVPGQADDYSLVKGTSVTPPAVPGSAVHYSVRTNVRGSRWTREVTISYPAPPPPPAPVPVDSSRTAPTLVASGRTLSWNKVGSVTTYVLVAKTAGKADQYSEVNGTSVTPAAVPGATVQYSVRTAVAGSAWSVPVSISYPAPAPTPTPTPPSTGSSGPFEVGLVSGWAPSYEQPFVSDVGARTVRVEFGVGTPAARLEQTFSIYASKGIRVLPLASFNGTLPSASDAQNLGSWAAEFGPGGTFWQGKSYPAGTAMTDIEFGNETSYEWQYSDNSSSAFVTRAQTYALRFKDAATAIHAANAGVGLLAQGDPGNAPGTSWMDNMFRAVPDLGQYVAGWTVHPYGPNWQSIMDKLLSSAQADGAPSSIPMWITEYGLATDNGHCLDDNYGWNKCMTYSEAASTLASVVSAMRARYGSRLAKFYLYHAHDLADPGSTSSRENYFGALTLEAAPKGAYTSEVESLVTANP